jgi:hypothetical protein
VAGAHTVCESRLPLAGWFRSELALPHVRVPFPPAQGMPHGINEIFSHSRSLRFRWHYPCVMQVAGLGPGSYIHGTAHGAAVALHRAFRLCQRVDCVDSRRRGHGP